MAQREGAKRRRIGAASGEIPNVVTWPCPIGLFLQVAHRGDGGMQQAQSIIAWVGGGFVKMVIRLLFLRVKLIEKRGRVKFGDADAEKALLHFLLERLSEAELASLRLLELRQLYPEPDFWCRLWRRRIREAYRKHVPVLARYRTNFFGWDFRHFVREFSEWLQYGYFLGCLSDVQTFLGGVIEAIDWGEVFSRFGARSEWDPCSLWGQEWGLMARLVGALAGGCVDAASARAKAAHILSSGFSSISPGTLKVPDTRALVRVLARAADRHYGKQELEDSLAFLNALLAVPELERSVDVRPLRLYLDWFAAGTREPASLLPPGVTPAQEPPPLCKVRLDPARLAEFRNL